MQIGSRLQHKLSTATARRRIFVLLVSAATITACATEFPLPAKTAAEQRTDWEAWKANRAKVLVSIGRPLSYTGLRWIPQGPITIGGDSTNAIQLLGRNVAARVGTLTREGARVRFEPIAGAQILIDSAPALAQWLRSDGDSGKPSRIEAGTAGFRIIKRVDSIGVRSWDTDRGNFDRFGPLQYFPHDSIWRIGATFKRNEKPDTVALATNSGVAEEYVELGVVHVKINDAWYDLTAYGGNGKADLFFSFSDATNGEETYGFRFLHAALDTLTNVVTFDLNYAYNPDCAFSSFTTCPLPPPNNRLKSRVPAGELAVKHVEAPKP